jgi:light-regulated signal transduction histidine kinase (bacteriophytochrome)
LELRVEERTAQLNAANKELDAFAYSVSHDLRAPLRGIDGFSLALLEDFGDKLDDTGKDYLNRVRNGCVRMGLLIDDMLKMSRLTRSDINRKTLDMSLMARKSIENLMLSEPDRKVEVDIQDGISGVGDATLIQTVLDNLLGNAWKFTEKKEMANISFGIVSGSEHITYFIADNGAGFNMDYAEKLFTAFQRLHSPGEFQGTGIGLASVQRIIHRHGGKIWAEGEEDKGATFYFTLS